MQNNTKFLSLAPKDDLGKSIYAEALDFAIKERNVKNIAVTGSYGSGKSSIIHSYIKNKECAFEKNVVLVSLASFNTKQAHKVYNKIQENEENEISSTIDSTGQVNKSLDNLSKDVLIDDVIQENKIEASILQQIISSVPKSNLPLSKISRIEASSWCNKIYLILTLLTTLLFILLNPPENMVNVIFKITLLGTFEEYEQLISNTLFVLICIGVIYFLTKYSGFSFLKKVNILGSELDISNSEQDPLNFYLSELIYFFQVTDKNVVIFEDLDRFENLNIFMKLREINQLLNSSAVIKKEIKFIYAIRDDVFTKTEDRTKFFDFIIPVIPHLDFSNSSSLLYTTLKEITDNEFKPELIEQISFYINDKRIVNDIANEFYIYKKQTEFENKNYDYDKLLALIAYKVLLPNDFNKLKMGMGYLYNIIHEFEQKSLQIKIMENIENKISSLNASYFDSNLDLKKKYLDIALMIKNTFLSSPNHKMYINSIDISNIKEVNINNLIINQDSKIKIERKYNSDSEREFSIEDLDQIIKCFDNQHVNYITLQERLSENSVRRKSEFEKQKKTLIGKNLSYLYSYVLNNERLRCAYFKLRTQEIEFELLDYFLINGLIDDTYYHYMTTHHENDFFPPIDKRFLMALRTGKHTNSIFSMPIKNPETLLRHINLNRDNYSKLGILNYSLFSWAAESNFEKERDTFLMIIDVNIKLRAYKEFKSLFLSFNSKTESYKNLIVFVLKILEKSYTLDEFNELVDTFESEKINDYLTLPILKSKTFKKGFLCDLKKLENFQPILMSLDEDNYESIGDAMVHYGFKLEKVIDERELNEYQIKFLTKLIANKLIDVVTIPFLLDTIYDFERDAIRKRAISILFHNKDSLKEIFEVAYENLNELLEVILLDTSLRYEDDEDAIFHMLDTLKIFPIDNQLLSKFLTNQRNKIKDISKLSSKGFIYDFLKLNILESNYNNLINVIELHDKFELDPDYSDPIDGYTYFEALTKFINIEENFMKLSKSTLSYTSILESFFFKNNKLDNKVLITILPKFNFTADDKNKFSTKGFIESVSISIVQLLISHKLLNLNIETAHYIFSNLDDFDIDIINNWIFRYKTEFIDNIEMYFSLDIEDLNDSLLDIIISLSNLHEKEKIYIYQHLIQSDLIQEKQEILFDALSLAYNKKLAIKDEIVVSGMKKIKERSKIIAYTIKFQNQLTKSSLREIYREFPDEQLQKISKPLSKINIENTDINKQFLNILKDKEIVRSIKEDGDNIIGNCTGS